MTGQIKHRATLEPCPFCGNAAWLHVNRSIFAGQTYDDYPNQNWGYRVECEGDCHAMTCWWHEQGQAEHAWNRRVER